MNVLLALFVLPIVIIIISYAFLAFITATNAKLIGRIIEQNEDKSVNSKNKTANSNIKNRKNNAIANNDIVTNEDDNQNIDIHRFENIINNRRRRRP